MSRRLPDGSKVGETNEQRSLQESAIAKWCSLFGYQYHLYPTCSPIDGYAWDENDRVAAVFEVKSRDCRSDRWPDVPLDFRKHQALLRCAMALSVSAKHCKPVFLWAWTDRVGWVDCYRIAGLPTVRKMWNGELRDMIMVPTCGPDIRFLEDA